MPSPKIYKIYIDECIITKKKYIGYTGNSLKERWRQKVYSSLSGHKTYKIHNAISKYGSDDWTHKILYCSKDLTHILEMEKYFIEKYDSYNSGYNSTLGGETPTFKNLSDSHKSSISKGLKESYRNKKRLPLCHSEKTKESIRQKKSTGSWHTPVGVFLSAQTAAKAMETSKTNIRNWCRSPDKIITKQTPKRLPDIFNESNIGKSYRSIGFYFVASNEL